MVVQSEENFGKKSEKGTQIRQSETGNEIIYTGITNPIDPAPVLNYLSPDRSARKALTSSMADYLSYITEMVPPQGLTYYKKMLDAETFLAGINPEGEFISLMSGLHSLQIMKNRLLTVESSVLSTIARHK